MFCDSLDVICTVGVHLPVGNKALSPHLICNLTEIFYVVCFSRIRRSKCVNYVCSCVNKLIRTLLLYSFLCLIVLMCWQATMKGTKCEKMCPPGEKNTMSWVSSVSGSVVPKFSFESLGLNGWISRGSYLVIITNHWSIQYLPLSVCFFFFFFFFLHLSLFVTGLMLFDHILH